MPSQITHVLAGLHARKRAGFLVESTLVPLFNMGCQGPDIFAHNRRTKPYALAFARLLHRRRYGVFCRTAAEHLITHPFPGGRVWLAGFVTHQAVDRALHPYIVYRSDRIPPDRITGVSPALYHAFFERIIDVLVLKKLTGRSVSSFNTDPLFKMDKQTIIALSRFIATILKTVFPENTTNDTQLQIRVENAFRDTRYFYHITNPARTGMTIPAECSAISKFADRGPAGVALLHPENPDPGIDWLNELHAPWKNPAHGELHDESVLNLLDNAIETAQTVLRCLESVLGGTEDAESLERLVGNTCLSIQKDDGSIAPVLYAEPFDLPGELQRKTALRREWIEAHSVDPVKDELV